MELLAGAAEACFLAACAVAAAAAGVLAANGRRQGPRSPEGERPRESGTDAEPSGADGKQEDAGTPCRDGMLDVMEGEMLRRECALELRRLALDARAMQVELREAVLQAGEDIAAARAVPPAEQNAADAAEAPALTAERLAEAGLPAPLRGGDVPEMPEAPDRGYLTDAEYFALTPAEKQQLALDRWPRKGKTLAERGLDYERWIAWLYEREGWTVRMSGALDGKADMGRDLIAWRKGMPVHIVQCKRWSGGPVREDVVMKLHGSCEAWKRENPGSAVQGVLVCTCAVSPEALRTAQTLGIAACASVNIGWPPAVKCCQDSSSCQWRKYLLPWDPGYDAVQEFIRVETVEEAEANGFQPCEDGF